MRPSVKRIGAWIEWHIVVPLRRIRNLIGCRLFGQHYWTAGMFADTGMERFDLPLLHCVWECGIGYRMVLEDFEPPGYRQDPATGDFIAPNGRRYSLEEIATGSYIVFRLPAQNAS